MARPVIDPSLGNPELQPAAQPTNTYYAPKLPAPKLQAVIDLSGLSQSLARVQAQQSAKDAEVQHQEALAFAQSPEAASILDELTAATGQQDQAESRRAAHQKAVQGLIKSGKLTLAESPWLDVAFQETAASKVMAQYAQDLTQRLEDVSTVIDPKTGLPQQPQAVDAIIADTWKRYGNNPIFGDYYGAKVLNQSKSQIEDGFRQKAANAIGQAKEIAHKQLTGSELSTFVKQYNTRLNSLDEEQRGMLTQKFKDLNLLGYAPDDQIALVKQMADAGAWDAASKASSADGAHFLEQLKTVKLPNGQPIGNMAGLSEYLDSRIVELRNRETSQRDVEERLRASARARAVVDLQADFWSAHAAAEKQGHNLGFSEWVSSVDPTKYEDFDYSVMQAKDQVARAATVNVSDKGAIEDLQRALAGGSSGPEIRQMVLSRFNQLSPDDRSRYLDEATKMSNVASQISQDPTIAATMSWMERTTQNTLSPVYGSDTANDAYQLALSRQDDYNQKVTAIFRDTSDPQARAAAITALNQETRQGFQKDLLEVRTKHDEVIKEARRLTSFRQDATEYLRNNAGLLRQSEYDEILHANQTSRDFTSLFMSMQGTIDVPLHASYADKTDLSNVMAAEDIANVHDQLEQYAGEWGKTATDPSKFRSAIQAKASELVKERISARSASPLPATTSETTAEAAQKEEIRLGSSAAADSGWEEAFKAGDRKGAAVAFLKEQMADPQLDSKAVAAAREALTEEDPSDRTAARNTFVMENANAIRRMMSASPDRPTAEARVRNYVTKMAPMIGVTSDDLLADKITVQPASEENIRAQKAALDIWSARYVPDMLRPALVAQVSRDGVFNPDAPEYANAGADKRLLGAIGNDFARYYNRANQKPLSIPLDGPIAPTTLLKDIPDMAKFAAEQPEKAAALAKKFGLDSVSLLVKYQQNARKRDS